jgi:hypothetical protein
MLTLPVSIDQVFFIGFFLSRVLFLSILAMVLMVRTVLLSVNIITFLRQLGIVTCILYSSSFLG